MDVIVSAPPPGASPIVRWTGGLARCVLGRSGIVRHKREGDGGTPAGRFPLRQVLYRPDRLTKPATGLAVQPIAADDGWCDDPVDPAYNRPVRLPYAASHERLWRDDLLYDLLIIIGYNDAPVVPGRGSAIFMHLASARDAPTAGCVALALGDLQSLVAACRPGDQLVVVAD